VTDVPGSLVVRCFENWGLKSQPLKKFTEDKALIHTIKGFARG
jgi:hypothetical protein